MSLLFLFNIKKWKLQKNKENYSTATTNHIVKHIQNYMANMETEIKLFSVCISFQKFCSMFSLPLHRFFRFSFSHSIFIFIYIFSPYKRKSLFKCKQNFIICLFNNFNKEKTFFSFVSSSSFTFFFFTFVIWLLSIASHHVTQRTCRKQSYF